MADVSATLRAALGQLEDERNRIDRQIAALKRALGESGGGRAVGRQDGSRQRGEGGVLKWALRRFEYSDVR